MMSTTIQYVLYHASSAGQAYGAKRIHNLKAKGGGCWYHFYTSNQSTLEGACPRLQGSIYNHGAQWLSRVAIHTCSS